MNLLIVAFAPAVLLMIGTGIGLAYLVEKKKTDNASAAATERATASQEGRVWRVSQLYSYLEAKGAVASMVVVEDGGGLPREPVEWKAFDTGRRASARLIEMDDAASAQARAERSSRKTDFAWGRFVISGDAEMLERVKSVLYE